MSMTASPLSDLSHLHFPKPRSFLVKTMKTLQRGLLRKRQESKRKSSHLQLVACSEIQISLSNKFYPFCDLFHFFRRKKTESREPFRAKRQNSMESVRIEKEEKENSGGCQLQSLFLYILVCVVYSTLELI